MQWIKAIRKKRSISAIKNSFKLNLWHKKILSLSYTFRAADSMKIIQQSAFEDRSMAQDQQSWNNAASFYEKLLMKYKEDVSKQLSERVGPDFKTRWTSWTRRDENQEARNQIQFELRRILSSEPNHGSQLASDEFTAIRKNLGQYLSLLVLSCFSF